MLEDSKWYGVKKSREECGELGGWRQVGILNRVIRVSIAEKVRFTQT